MNPITILIIEDHKLVREAWLLVLSKDSRFNVLAEYGTAEDGIKAAKNLLPQVVLLDINLPGISGIEAIPQIKEASPSTKIIGVSQHTIPSYARKMMKLGAMGYVTKNSSKVELMEAIIEVHSGKKFMCSYIKEMIAEQFTLGEDEGININKLSIRELEIIDLIRKGLSSIEIAKELSVSAKTVEVHRYNILKKLKQKNTASLLNFLNKS